MVRASIGDFSTKEISNMRSSSIQLKAEGWRPLTTGELRKDEMGELWLTPASEEKVVQELNEWYGPWIESLEQRLSEATTRIENATSEVEL